MLYQSWVLRFVPDVARGEFTNIGVLVGNDGMDWHLITTDSNRSNQRLLTAAPIARLGTRVRKANQAADQLAGVHTSSLLVDDVERMRELFNNILQLSPPTPLLAQSAEQGAKLLYDQLVSGREQRGPQSRTRLVNRIHQLDSEFARANTAWRHYNDGPIRFFRRSTPGLMRLDSLLASADQSLASRAFSLTNMNPQTSIERLSGWLTNVRGFLRHNGTIDTDGRATPLSAEQTKIVAVYDFDTTSEEGARFAADFQALCWDESVTPTLVDEYDPNTLLLQ